MESGIVLFVGMVRRGEFESLQKRDLPLGVLADTNSKHRLGDVSVVKHRTDGDAQGCIRVEVPGGRGEACFNPADRVELVRVVGDVRVFLLDDVGRDPRRRDGLAVRAAPAGD